MKRGVFLILMVLFAQVISAQGNLVPNPSFEEKTTCQFSNGAFVSNVVLQWSSPNAASPDYFNTCGTPFFVDVPENFSGYQYAFGNGYAGIVNFSDGFFEYIEVKLTTPLEAGETYCVSYFVCLAEQSNCASIGPQAFFSSDSINSSTFLNFNYTPQIQDTAIIYDTLNWVRIYGEFNASGGEQYLTLGNFRDASSTPYDTVDFSSPDSRFSYYYIDSVIVYKKVFAEAGPDLQICYGDSIQIGVNAISSVMYSWNTSIHVSDSAISDPWVRPTATTTYYVIITDTGSLYCTGDMIDSVVITVEDCRFFHVPTILQVGEVLQIDSLPEYSKLELYDARGRIVYRTDNYQNDFNTIALSSGMYFYYFEFQDGWKQGGKICLIR